MRDVKFFYIRNMEEANFFIQNGLIPTACGVELNPKSKRKEVFIKFVRNDKANEIFNTWCKRNK